MEWKEFDEYVKGVKLYAGTLESVNRRLDVLREGIRYVEVPMEGDIQFLEGILLPSKEEVETLADWEVGLEPRPGVPKYEFRTHRLQIHRGIFHFELEDLVEDAKYKTVLLDGLSNAEDREEDFRYKARKLGADAIINVSYFGNVGGFRSLIGTPVKKENGE
jgi:hypothetical protein